MRDGERAVEAGLELPESARSHDGYAFSPASDRWRLSKGISFSHAWLRGTSSDSRARSSGERAFASGFESCP